MSKEFYMEASIIVDSKKEIVEALREIADKIEKGTERDWIPGEVQGAEWYVGDEEEPSEDNNLFGF